MNSFTDAGTWEYGDITYSIVGYINHTRKVVIEKSNRWGIHYDEIKVTNITRKLNKDCKISLEGFQHNLKVVNGFDTVLNT